MASRPNCERLHELAVAPDHVSGTVFVVDADPAVHEMIRRLTASVDLATESYMRGEDFLSHHDPQHVGCLLLDLHLPGLSGLDVQGTLAARASTLPIIMLGARASVRMVVHALKAGAFDFVEKPVKEQALLDDIQAALRAHQHALRQQWQHAAIAERLAGLSPRERQVMELMAAGRPNKVIGATLGISEKTVEVHRGNLTRKLRAESLADVVRLAVWADAAA